MNERSIFEEALDKGTLAERSAFLDEQCANDMGLRRRVEALLKSHLEAGSFLGTPVPDRLAEKLAVSIDQPDTEGAAANADNTELIGLLSASNRPGSLGRLGHYEVLDVLGRGSFGIVVRAFDEMLHRVVAIKVMAPQLAATSPPRKRFLREARAAAAIRHDNVVNIYSVDEQPIPFLVMEYIDGPTLQQKLNATGPLDVPDVLRLGQQIAKGLAAAHAIGLVHRDIKPGNILLENRVEERVKITDFGLARAADDASLTQTGVIAGTPMYMSPEQASGEPIDHRADLFSLGSVLYVMVSGRPPFRGSSPVAVLKRVVDDTPRPIREIIPETPRWLCDVITKLHEKTPDARFQSAEEVAEILGRYLAHVEQPSMSLSSTSEGKTLHDGPLLGKPNDKPIANAWSAINSHSRWAIATILAFLLVLGSLSVTEATGVTSLRTTVLRIFTPEGTLVVEVGDPDVKVTIEGGGGIVIIGTDLQEIRLKPGSYKVQAAKDGKPVRLDQDLVTITRGDTQVVRVRMEVEAAAVILAAKVEPDAFVVLGAAGAFERKFEALAVAVQGASDGDTIEVRGDGPFVTKPINLGKIALTIRAGEGFRPVIKLSPEGLQVQAPLLETQAALVLEGLELQHLAETWKEGPPWPALLRTSKDLHVANCRFLMSNTPICIDGSSPVFELRNCEFLRTDNYGGAMVNLNLQSAQRLVIDNCLVTVFARVNTLEQHKVKGAFVQLTRNTFRAKLGAFYFYHEFDQAPRPEDLDQRAKLLSLETSGNIFDAGYVFQFEQTPPDKVLPAREKESYLAHTIGWVGECNLYAVDGPFFALDSVLEPIRTAKNLTDWRRFWATAEANSIEGRVRYEGGDLLAKLVANPEQLTPEDFRLRSDSAGYRAGKDGKDLGAEIDLVGPGKAYERWKKTPEYQQWLNETGQVSRS